ncbi:hypothetical protein SteCoe_13246 [Stentor coeruleus]|uniref:Kinesin motor domain-containing protein n=1 Tax=Stentor coeruleus TaxID=5963 RepID=A0A1R2C8T0_9CILI|nr:hypothetical protein SteCoe_13246 [Stentor coeruleus]
MADSESDSEVSDNNIESSIPENLLDVSSNSRGSNGSYRLIYSPDSDMLGPDLDDDAEKSDSASEAQLRNRANDLAKSQIKKIEQEMKKMHQKHCQLLKGMDSNYAAIEQETHQRYIEFINKWKDQLKLKIDQYRKVIESLNMEISEMKDLNSNSQEIINKAISEKKIILEKYNKEIHEKDLIKEKELASMQTSYEKQINNIKKENSEITQKYNELCEEKEKFLQELEFEKMENAKLRTKLTDYKSRQKDLKSKLGIIETHYSADVSYFTIESLIMKIEENENIRENALTMRAKIEKIRKKKVLVKKKITLWQQDFEKINGRKCDNADKEQIKHLYAKYMEKNKKQEQLQKKYEVMKMECNSKKIIIEERNPGPLKLRSRSPSSNLNISVDSVITMSLRERERKTPREEGSNKEKSESLENVRKDLRYKVSLSGRSSNQTSNNVANNIIVNASSLELQQIKQERDQLKSDLSKAQLLLRESKKDVLGPVIEETQIQLEKTKKKASDLEKKLAKTISMAEKYKQEYVSLMSQMTETQDLDNAEMALLKSQLAYCNSELVMLRDKLVGTESQLDIDLMYQKKKLMDENFNLQGEINKLKEKIQTTEQGCQDKIKDIESKNTATVRQMHDELQKVRRDIVKLQEAEKELKVIKDKHKIEKANLENNCEQLEIKLTTSLKEIQDLRQIQLSKEQELKDSMIQRKVLHNELEDLRGKIRVYCRVRPMSEKEVSKGCSNVIAICDEFSVNLESKQGQVKNYVYDTVFGPTATQEEVFEDSRRLIQSAVDGFNVCIFAYGQTGSGKTYTIQGYPGYPGIAPRAIDELFQLTSNLPQNYSCTITCYMVELYLQHLVDLLRPKSRDPSPSLTIKTDLKGMVYIPEAYIVAVSSAEQLKNVYDDGIKNRHISKTKMNNTSSRSHLIFSIIIEVVNNNEENEVRTVGKMCFVDLAGSERTGRSEATAESLKETNAINKSLSALSDVISALLNKVSYIPYRNNKLTMLMSDSIGGTAKTLMFVNISPASINREETMISLYYGSRVKLITNEPTKNIESKELARLRSELLQAQETSEKYRNQLISIGVMQKDPEDDCYDNN